MKFLAALIIFLLSYNAQAALLSLSPANNGLNSGDSFTVSVMLEPQGSSVYGAQFDLLFDKTIVEASDIEKGTLFGSDGAATIEGVKSIDNANGRVSYSLSRSGVSTGINSSGTIAQVTFRGLNYGTSAITFANVIISDTNATEIPSTKSGGSVTVAGTPAPTTPTPALTVTEADSSSKGTATTSSVVENNTLELTHPDNTVLTLSSVRNVSEGDEFAVDVSIRATEPVYGAEFKLSFDNVFLEGTALEQGEFLQGALVVNSINNEKGELTYAETRVGNVSGVKAKGILAKAKFRAKKAGSTRVNLGDIKLVNENESMINNVLYSGIELNISKREVSKKADLFGVYWVLVILAVLGLGLRKRKIAE